LPGTFRIHAKVTQSDDIGDNDKDDDDDDDDDDDVDDDGDRNKDDGRGGVRGTVGVAGQQRLPGLVSILQHWHRLQHVAPKMICDQLQLFVAASGSHF